MSFEVNIDPRCIIKQGYLTKSPPLTEATFISKRWHRRWFVLYDTQARADIDPGIEREVELLYYKSDVKVTQEAPKGKISLVGVHIFTNNHKVHGYPNAISIKTDNRLYHLCAAQIFVRDEWLKKIREHHIPYIEEPSVPNCPSERCDVGTRALHPLPDYRSTELPDYTRMQSESTCNVVSRSSTINSNKSRSYSDNNYDSAYQPSYDEIKKRFLPALPSRVTNETEQIDATPSRILDETERIYATPSRILRENKQTHATPSRILDETEQIYATPSRILRENKQTHATPSRILPDEEEYVDGDLYINVGRYKGASVPESEDEGIGRTDSESSNTSLNTSASTSSNTSSNTSSRTSSNTSSNTASRTSWLLAAVNTDTRPKRDSMLLGGFVGPRFSSYMSSNQSKPLTKSKSLGDLLTHCELKDIVRTDMDEV